MVWQRLTIKKVATNLYIAETTVWRVVDTFQRIGGVSIVAKFIRGETGT